MRKYALFLAIGIVLAACSSPIDRVKTLDDVELSEDAEPLNISASRTVTERKGFFAFLRPKVDQPESIEGEFSDGEVIVADDIVDDTSVPSVKRGLFGFLSRNSPEADAAPPATGPASQLVSTGMLLPYGEIGTNCEVSPQELGTRVSNASGYGLFDTGGNTEAARSFYLTGFPDACARQFTAAMVMFGDVGTYEVLRYKTGRKASSATDKAYDLIQSQFCGVSVGEPCGAQLDALSKSTTFLTAYESFGTNGHWADILIHDGHVVSVELREP